MEDSRIIELYFARNEEAIRHTDDTYGRRLFVLADNIVRNDQDAEYGSFLANEKKKSSGIRTLGRKPLLIAAIIGLMLFLMGCAWVVMKMQDFKIGQTSDEQYVFADDGITVIGTETVERNVLTLAGMKGTAAYNANAEWYAYQDFLIEANYAMTDGNDPFARGTAWKLHIEDLIHSYFDEDKNNPVDIILAEGEWLFPIPFSDEFGDYREMELVSEPVSAKASVGWKPDGTDILEEVKITSFVLRRFSADIVCDNPDAIFDFINGQPLAVVMEGGTEIELLYGPHYYALNPIDLDQVDYVQLPDGTKLNMP